MPITHLRHSIEKILNDRIIAEQPLGGGCISSNWIVTTSRNHKYMIKTGLDSDIYLCEANGLNEIRQTETIRVPSVMSVGSNYILMEEVETKRPSADFFSTLGRQLANMHKHTAQLAGFYEDNFIGSNPQINEKNTSWQIFYFRNRLLYQFCLAEKNGYITTALRKKFGQLESVYAQIIPNRAITFSLLHGDLWSGNFLCDEKDKPVLIDPAVYYGDRETDLAMTKLFGGFPPDFYKTYHETYPLEDGWEYRENIYKLYHVLNHLNLFGKGYLSETESLIDFYL